MEQVEFLATLRHREGYPIEEQGCRGEERHDDLTRQRSSGHLLDHVLDGQREHVGLRSLDTCRKAHGRHTDNRAVADAHKVAEGDIIIDQEREDIYIGDA